MSDECAAKKCRQAPGIILRGLPLCATHEAKAWELLRQGVEDKESIKQIVPRTRWDELT